MQSPSGPKVYPKRLAGLTSSGPDSIGATPVSKFAAVFELWRFEDPTPSPLRTHHTSAVLFTCPTRYVAVSYTHLTLPTILLV